MYKKIKLMLVDPKKYIKVSFSFILVFLLFHAIIYNFFTNKIINIEIPYTVGDLSRMSYQTDTVYKRKYEISLPKQHIPGSEYKKEMQIDILTIGDSFSNGVAGGKNPFYQDYIASINNFNVLNINELHNAGSIVNTVISLVNSTVLEEIAPKIVLIQTGSRALVTRYTSPIDKNITMDKELIYQKISQMKINDISKLPIGKIPFINTANYKFLSYTLQYTRKDCLSNNVCRLSLKEDFFSSENKSMLEFYKKNITVIPSNTYENIDKVNTTLNYLSDLLKSKNIQLYVMVAVDKLDLYSPYLLNNPYPTNNIFNYLRSMEKSYKFIDTKKIFSENLKNNNTKDLYFVDDTHWSSKASKIMVENILFDLD